MNILDIVLSGGVSRNAYYVTTASIYEMDCLASWNFKHIVRRNTQQIVRMLNMLNDLKDIEILTPAHLL